MLDKDIINLMVYFKHFCEGHFFTKLNKIKNNFCSEKEVIRQHERHSVLLLFEILSIRKLQEKAFLFLFIWGMIIIHCITSCHLCLKQATQTEPSLPGIPPNPIYKNSVPVKVTTVQLCSSPLWPPYCFDDNEVMQRGVYHYWKFCHRTSPYISLTIYCCWYVANA